MSGKQIGSAEAVWRERLARFAKSTLTVREFCRQEGVSDPSFYQWRKRLRQSRGNTATVSPTGNGKVDEAMPFVPVSISCAASTEVEFPNGVRIRVPATNAEALRIALVTGGNLCQEVK